MERFLVVTIPGRRDSDWHLVVGGQGCISASPGSENSARDKPLFGPKRRLCRSRETLRRRMCSEPRRPNVLSVLRFSGDARSVLGRQQEGRRSESHSYVLRLQKSQLEMLVVDQTLFAIFFFS